VLGVFNTELVGSAWRLLNLRTQMRQSWSARWPQPRPCPSAVAGTTCLREGGVGQCHCLWGLLPALLAAAGGCATQGCGTATLTAGTLPACPATSHAGYTVRQAHKLTEQATDGQGQRLEHGKVHIQPLAIVGVCHLRCMGQRAVLGRRVSGWVTGWGRGNRAEAGRHNSKALPGVKRMQASRQRMVLACAGL
jgi:hypothetical protein